VVEQKAESKGRSERRVGKVAEEHIVVFLDAARVSVFDM